MTTNEINNSELESCVREGKPYPEKELFNSLSNQMAVLIHNPELARQLINVLEAEEWPTEATQWLWDKMRTHYSEHRAIPSYKVLVDMVGKEATNSAEKVMMEATKNFLEQFDTPLSVEDTKYFTDSIMSNVKTLKCNLAMKRAFQDGDYREMINTVSKLQIGELSVPMMSLDEFTFNDPKTDPNNLLNDTGLERESCIAITGPAGSGKSVLCIQLASHFSCGKPCLGFVPVKPLKCLAVQCEDSNNDVARMKDGTYTLLNQEEQSLVNENLKLVRLRGVSGDKFLTKLDMYCEQFWPDIIFINPILKYFGGEPINTKESNKFLNELDTILKRYNCGVILIHHTIKQGEGQRKNKSDSIYSMAGAAAWANYVRDNIELQKVQNMDSDKFYKLINTKRASLWGWKEKFIKRSDDHLHPLWLEAKDELLEELQAQENQNVQMKHKVQEAVPIEPDKITMKELMRLTGISERSVRKYLNEDLIKRGVVFSNETTRPFTYYRKAN